MRQISNQYTTLLVDEKGWYTEAIVEARLKYLFLKIMFANSTNLCMHLLH